MDVCEARSSPTTPSEVCLEVHLAVKRIGRTDQEYIRGSEVLSPDFFLFETIIIICLPFRGIPMKVRRLYGFAEVLLHGLA